MSKTQAERLAVIETEITTLKGDVSEIKQMLKDHVEWESNKYETLSNLFAGKWVEKITIAVTGSVITAIIVGFKG